MVEKIKIKSIRKLENYNNDYVYDIGINSSKAHNWFFANNILVHNSSQFSAWPTIKPLVEKGETEWNKDNAVALYTAISDKVNDSFAPLMERSFNCPNELGTVIRAGCESVGERGLYITKKHYAILNYYYDGKRYDTAPKLKAMGLDLRRSDTPEICQEFLTEILMELLKGESEEHIIGLINAFKKQFKALPLHEQGSPKRVNAISKYTELIKAGRGNRVPGHVRAAINWNMLREANKDKVHTRILDGMKCVVCPLKPNHMNMTNIAYPIDEVHLPNWFTALPFDTESMMSTVVEKKIENLFGKLPSWKKIENATRKLNTFDDFFS